MHFMEQKLQQLAQYTLNLSAQALVRPYDNKKPVKLVYSGNLRSEALAEPNHYRIVLAMQVNIVNSDGMPCGSAVCAMESIVLAAGMENPQDRERLTLTVGGLLLGDIRAALTTASATLGYGQIILPALSSEQLRSLMVE